MTQTQPQPLERPRAGRVVAGVSRAVAGRAGVGVGLVRLAFVVLTLTGGIGLVAYGAGWLFIRSEGESRSPASQWLDRLDASETPSQRLGWWLLTAIALASIAATTAVGAPFVIVTLIVLAGWRLLAREVSA